MHCSATMENHLQLVQCYLLSYDNEDVFTLGVPGKTQRKRHKLMFQLISFTINPAPRAESARAVTGRRCPTLGWGKTFWRVGRVPLTKTDVTRKRKIAQ